MTKRVVQILLKSAFKLSVLIIQTAPIFAFRKSFFYFFASVAVKYAKEALAQVKNPQHSVCSYGGMLSRQQMIKTLIILFKMRRLICIIIDFNLTSYDISKYLKKLVVFVLQKWHISNKKTYKLHNLTKGPKIQSLT